MTRKDSELRVQVSKLLKQGIKQADVMRQVGCSRPFVSWCFKNLNKPFKEERPSDVKRCYYCKQTKPAINEYFAKNHLGTLGLNNICKECRKGIDKRKRDGNLEQSRAESRESARNRRDKIREYKQSKKEELAEYHKNYREANAQKYRDYASRRRVRINGGKLEPVTLQGIYKRDKGICYLCQEKVDISLKFPHPMSASRDHVKPVSKDGDHTWENVKLTHLVCNMRKSDR
jgi:hypothetical protein